MVWVRDYREHHRGGATKKAYNTRKYTQLVLVQDYIEQPLVLVQYIRNVKVRSIMTCKDAKIKGSSKHEN